MQHIVSSIRNCCIPTPTMKVVTSVILISACVVLISAENKYTTKYDSVDVDKILNNERVLANYIKCLMDEGPCTPEGRELKKTLPDALEGGCGKCNEKQKITADKVTKHLMENKPKEWERLTKKYDPQGLHKRRYEEALAKTHVN